jgi:hypothetical protein
MHWKNTLTNACNSITIPTFNSLSLSTSKDTTKNVSHVTPNHRFCIMHPTHVPSPHHPSSSNTKKDHVSSPPPIGEASNNFSLLHDNQPSNSSLPLDEPSLDTKKVNGISPSPTTHNHAYELRDFFDGGFSSLENYEMDLDAKDVSFKCVEKPQDKISLIHGDDLFSTNKKKNQNFSTQ